MSKAGPNERNLVVRTSLENDYTNNINGLFESGHEEQETN